MDIIDFIENFELSLDFLKRCARHFIPRSIVTVVLLHFWTQVQAYDNKIPVCFHAISFTIAWYIRRRKKAKGVGLLATILLTAMAISYYELSELTGYVMTVFSDFYQPFYEFQIYFIGKISVDYLYAAGKYLLLGTKFKISSKVTDILSLGLFIYFIFFKYRPNFPRRPADLFLIVIGLTHTFFVCFELYLINYLQFEVALTVVWIFFSKRNRS